MKKLLFLLALYSNSCFSAGFTLTWIAPTTGPVPDGYIIYIGTASGQYNVLTADATKRFIYVVNSLTPGTKYYIAAKSYLGSYAAPKEVSKSYSNEVSAIAGNVISAPVNLSIKP